MDSTEIKIIKLAKKGNHQAFSDLVDLYKNKIYHLGYRMLGNKQEAEDITQETFLRVYKSIHKYDAKYKFSTWIFRIGTNLCIDRLRKRKNAFSLDAETIEGEGIDGYDILPSEDDSPDQQLIISETQRHVREAIDKLPEKYKSVVVLRYLHDLSLQEVGDILNMPVTTVKTRVHRGREYLRKKLEHGNLM
ncbi:RNA polymerase sigma factor SigW [Chengkuizengella sp. SCS-71B]|uniref:RNA polymerase sigma factor SigW n=1 Tax=Chengkuizengella sp. SCS-71B TaxID=3115290 RepID=UPI0032C20ED8